jgi:PPE-repeat protein
VESNPASLVEKVRNLAIKREQQAATAANNSVAKELSATAKSYRALADALAKKPDNLLDKLDEKIDSKLESKIG